MEENISSKVIINRKISVEFRYRSTMAIVDKRGYIIDQFKQSNIFPVKSWGIGDDKVLLRDGEEDETSANRVVIAHNGCSVTSYSIHTVEEFYVKVDKIFKLLKDTIGELFIRKITCRITGVYKLSSNKYGEIVKRFTKAFPQQFLLNDYPVTDLAFKCYYENGQYEISPFDDNDERYEDLFVYEKTQTKAGLFIETNNYVLSDGKKALDKSAMKDVYVLSLSIEKDLYEKLSLL